ncbi:MAG TPA: Rid family hydrolase [Solirubrobacteraceae bacterium]|nr:Rid family hydrolase [Solirubrobacteraceae bacterium]
MTAPQRFAGDPPSPYELEYGFSRVVRAGGFVLVGGTTSVGPGGSVVGETPYEQAIVIFRKLLHELERVGLGAADVVHSRVYVTDISRAEEVGRAHGEIFASHRPLMTLVEVSGLIDPRMLVEIETVAYAG